MCRATSASSTTCCAASAAIDFVLLVVAADDGVMPQTREHLAILHLLGVSRGAVAVTKIDRVPPARVDEVKTEVDRLLATTRLAGTAVFPVSSITGAGIAALLEHLEQAARATTAQESGRQLPPQRGPLLHPRGRGSGRDGNRDQRLGGGRRRNRGPSHGSEGARARAARAERRGGARKRRPAPGAQPGRPRWRRPAWRAATGSCAALCRRRCIASMPVSTRSNR